MSSKHMINEKSKCKQKEPMRSMKCLEDFRLVLIAVKANP
jgi:hypothetical protein